MTAKTSRARVARRAALCLSAVLASGLAAPVWAQTAPAPEMFRNDDEHDVDLTTGTFNPTVVEGQIGDSGEGLKLKRHWGQSGWRDNWSGEIRLTGTAGSQTAILTFGDISEKFTEGSGGIWINAKANGATLTAAPGNVGTTYTYTASNGTRITYTDITTLIGFAPPNLSITDTQCSFAQANNCALPTSIVDPDGSAYSLTWKTPTDCVQDPETLEYTSCNVTYRLTDVRSRSAYALKFKYVTNVWPNAGPNYNKRSSAKFYDLTQVYCDPVADNCDTVTAAATVSYAYPSSTMTDVTDAKGGSWRFTLNANGKLGAIRRPGAAADTTSVTYGTNGRVTNITDDRGSKGYTWTVGASTTTVNTTSGAGQTATIVSSNTTGQPTSITNATGNTATTTFDASNRVTRITQPEGDYVNYTYDARGNVTETRRVAKPGSGLADIVITAAYDATCTNSLTCDKPNYVIDAKGNRTDYTYDATHGGVTRVQLPAATTGGIRPETNYTYSAIYPQYRDQTNNLVNGPVPEYKVTQITSCATAATCAGSASETKFTFTYNTLNLKLASVTTASGNGALSSTVSYSYDLWDDLKTVDGPLPGSDDTTTYFYLIIGRRNGVVGPDPDGAGSRQRPAERYTYNTTGKVIRVERGYASAATQAAFDAMTVTDFVDITYDIRGNPITRAIKSGTTTHAVTQFSYNADNRLLCSAVRMNPAAFASLPSDACVATTLNATYGPDRITKNSYDANRRLTKVQTAFGQTEQADEATFTYTANSQTATVKDAEANLTTYEYDGFDRVKKTRFPVATQGQATSSATDYEQLTYDANSNVTTYRLRDGQTIAFAYDNHDRMIYQDRPGAELDWSATYNLAGQPTLIQDSSGYFTGYAWDALGRPTAESSPLGVFGLGYDAAGKLNLLVYPDNFYVNYDYDLIGNVTVIRENGATSGPGVLATYNYDSLGRRIGLTRGNGTSSSYSFDTVSRLTAIGQDLAGTANDLTIGSMSYNPASQILSQVKSNDAYAWNGHYNVNRNYSVNGLNQLTAAGATGLGYDARGNLSTSGSGSYGYDSLNRMTSAPGLNLNYDPLDRLSGLVAGSATTKLGYVGSQLLIEKDAAGTLLRRYVPGPGVDEPVVWYEGAGTADRRWLHADERGSVIAVSDGSGAMLAINRYDEYGIPRTGNVGRFQYTGQAWLGELGMYYYKARIYSPTLGRFMQTDPIGYGDGLNWYNYVGSDPVNAIDPSGLGEVCNPDGSCFQDGLDDIVVEGRRNSAAIYVRTVSVFRDSQGGSGGLQSGTSLWDKAKSVICKIPTLGFGGGIDAYAGVGGTVAGGYSLDIRTGQISGFFSVGVGVGVGGGSFYQGTVNAPSGITGSVTANVAATAGVGAAGSYTLFGSGAGTFSGGVVRAGPNFSANANIAGGGSVGLPKLYDAGCGK